MSVAERRMNACQRPLRAAEAVVGSQSILGAIAANSNALTPLMLPIRVRADQDGMNARVNRWKRTRRKGVWTEAFELVANEAGWPESLPWPRAVVTITCIAARGCEMDSDNLAGCAKAVRDLVAKRLGAGDGPRGPITWRYQWERGPDGTRITTEEDA